MSVTKEQFCNGVVKYLDDNVIPVLPTKGKWVVGTAAALFNPDSVINTIRANPILSGTGVISDSGLIDIDRLAAALIASASKYGSLSLDVPLVGTLTFSADDVEKLRVCINGGS